MKKKILLSFLVIVGLVAITGCGNNEKESNVNSSKGNDIKEYKCTKTANYDSYKIDKEVIFMLDKDNKIKTSKNTDKYIYNTDSEYKTACEEKTGYYQTRIQTKYTGHEETLECVDSSKTIINITTNNFDNLDETIRSNYHQLHEDNTFDIDEWKEKIGNSNKWNCNF